MRRYETCIENDVLYIEGIDDGWLEIGSLESICELVGGETYTIEYDQAGRMAAWVNTDDDGTFTFDVRETLTEFTFDEEFVSHLAQVEMNDEDGEGYPYRTAFFADMMTTIWEAKGPLEGTGNESVR